MNTDRSCQVTVTTACQDGPLLDLPQDLQTVIALAETHQPKTLTAAERHRFGLPVPDSTEFGPRQPSD